MKKASDKSPTESLIDKLELKFKPTDEFFTVKLPDGDEIVFKHIRDLSERKAMRQFVGAFADRIESKNVHPDLRQYLPIDRDIAESLGVICYLSHEPKFSEKDVLRLHRMPLICDLLAYQVQSHMIDSLISSDIEEIEKEKKDSATTHTVASD